MDLLKSNTYLALLLKFINGRKALIPYAFRNNEIPLNAIYMEYNYKSRTNKIEEIS